MGADVERNSGVTQDAEVARYLELLLTEVKALGAGGGLAAASIYDTAQVLRYAPDPDRQRRLNVIEWLLQQQQVTAPQGEGKGWGKRGVSPLAQSVPTMAALLALHEHTADCPEDLRKKVQEAVKLGVEFMRQNAQAWAAAIPLPDDIPVAIELILPRLLDDAPLDWDLPRQSFKTLRELGEKRLGLIARFKPGPESTPAHAWEAWGGDPEMRWLMSVGNRVTDGVTHGITERFTVGHSPSATAFWLKKKREEFKKLHGDDSNFEASDFIKKIRNYLADCTASTQTEVPGTYPTCYPINRWEQLWGLLSLYETGLQLLCSYADEYQSNQRKPVGTGSDHDARNAHVHGYDRLKRIFTSRFASELAQYWDAIHALKDAVKSHLEDVDKALNPKEGMGLSDHFICDGDDTAAALSVLLATQSGGELEKLKACAEALRVRFERGGGQFTTYPHELQPSLTTTAHWVLVLKLLEKDVSASVKLVAAQQEDEGSSWEGLWLVDKWHCSWLYATSQSMIALELAVPPHDEKGAVPTAANDGELLEFTDGVLLKAVPRLIARQNRDGSWGEPVATCTETAFGARSLLSLRGRPRFEKFFEKDGEATRALENATRWLAGRLEVGSGPYWGDTYWIDKEPFATPRLDRLYVLSSLIMLKFAGY